MQALVFGVAPGFEPPDIGGDDNPLLTSLAATPMALQELPDPPLLGDDWVVLRTRLKQHETDAIKVAFDFR